MKFLLSDDKLDFKLYFLARTSDHST